MGLKRSWILVFGVLFISFFFSIFIFNNITANATGTMSLCLAKPPILDTISNQTAIVNSMFNYQVNASLFSSNSSVTYYENTTIFNINNSGFIQFSPASNKAGLHFIEIIVQDASSCFAINDSTNFFLRIIDSKTLIFFSSPLFPTADLTPDINFTTQKNASCQYKERDGSFSNMSTTGFKFHSQTLSTLVTGTEYTYIVECNATAGGSGRSSISFVTTAGTANSRNNVQANITANKTQIFNFINRLNITLNISANLTQQPIVVSEFNTTPLLKDFSLSGSTTKSFRFYSISVSDLVEESINKVSLTFHYNETDLEEQGIDENNIRVYYYNPTSDAWELESDYSIDQVANTIEVNTDHLSTFVLGSATVVSSEEAAAAATTSGGGGGGGGGMAIAKPEVESVFELSEETIKITVKNSEKAYKNIIVTNLGEELIELEVMSDSNLVSISPHLFSLSSGGKKTFSLIFNSQKNALPDIYLFQIKVKSKSTTKIINVVLEIESDKVLFDGSLDLKKKELFAGEILESLITISGFLPGSVDLTYTISDYIGSIILIEKEQLSLDDQVSFSKLINLPKNMSSGDYILSLKIKYKESLATATETFSIKSSPTLLKNITESVSKSSAFIFILPLIIFIMLVIAFFLFRFYKKINQEKQVINLHKINVLNKKMAILKNGYDEGYIRKETFVKTKRNINNEIKILNSKINKNYKQNNEK